MRRRLAITAGVTTVLAVLLLLVYVDWVSKRAQFALRTGRELSEQKEQPTLEELRRYYGSKLKVNGCDASGCAYTLTVSNRVLAALHLVPYTEMESYFWVRNGLVLRNMLDYMTTVDRRYNVTAHADVQFDKECVFALDPWNDSSPFNSNGLASISSDCSNAEKQAVFGLDTSCLTRLGGCRSVADLLPTIWGHNASKAIECRIPNREGFVHSPPSWTWMK
ncbi:MAG: hypothetical protein ABSD98_13065 [Candidatus Korobacteraceae bacterium]|jgi:hypothetical protein